MRWLDKLERKFGKICIPNLMAYIVITNLFVFLLRLFPNAIDLTPYLTLVPELVFRGQVWRLITYIFIPPTTSIIWILFTLYFYYIIGSTIESEWGSFKFNVYYFCGMIGTTIAALFFGSATGLYINLSLFFAFAELFPDFQFMLFFMIPVKAKYIAWVDWAFFLLNILFAPLSYKIGALMAIINFFLFFGPNFVRRIKNFFRRRKYRQQWNNFHS